jgi:hypothetical protein
VVRRRPGAARFGPIVRIVFAEAAATLVPTSVPSKCAIFEVGRQCFTVGCQNGTIRTEASFAQCKDVASVASDCFPFSRCGKCSPDKLYEDTILDGCASVREADACTSRCANYLEWYFSCVSSEVTDKTRAIAEIRHVCNKTVRSRRHRCVPLAVGRAFHSFGVPRSQGPQPRDIESERA